VVLLNSIIVHHHGVAGSLWNSKWNAQAGTQFGLI